MQKVKKNQVVYDSIPYFMACKKLNFNDFSTKELSAFCTKF